MNKKISIAFGILILTTLIVIAIFIPKNTTPHEIPIGFVGPLTGDGAAWGEIERNTIELAIDEINSDEGIHGKKLRLISEDGKCEGKAAVAAAQKLIEVDQVNILLVSCSQEVVPIAPIAEASKTLTITSYASASNISGIGSYTFRNSYTNRDMAHQMVAVALSKGNRIAMISEDSAFASDIRTLFTEHLNKKDISLVSDQHFAQGTKNLRTEVIKVLSEKPDVVVVNPNGPATGSEILKQLHTIGYRGVIIGNFFGGSKEIQSLKESEGMIYVSDPVLVDNSNKKELFEKYKIRFGTYPDLEWPLGARYDAVYILKKGLLSVGENPTALRDYLSSMESFTGILGTYRFDENNDITNVQPSIAVIRNRKSMAYPEN